MAIAGGLLARSGRGPASSLLIGIGNPLRGDDGVGPWLVETWGRRRAWRDVAQRGALAAAAAAAADPLVDAVEDAGGDLPGRLRLRVVDQLLPELAEELAAVRRVLFVDAWRSPALLPSEGSLPSGAASPIPLPGAPCAAVPPADGPLLLPITAAGPVGMVAERGAAWTPAHQLTAASLLPLSQGLYGRCPAASMLLIPAERFDPTDPRGGSGAFSARVRQQMPRAWQLLDQWLQVDPAGVDGLQA